MSGEKISVIIPCYNVKDMVSECLDSIVAQTIGLEPVSYTHLTLPTKLEV